MIRWADSPCSRGQNTFCFKIFYFFWLKPQINMRFTRSDWDRDLLEKWKKCRTVQLSSKTFEIALSRETRTTCDSWYLLSRLQPIPAAFRRRKLPTAGNASLSSSHIPPIFGRLGVQPAGRGGLASTLPSIYRETENLNMPCCPAQ